MARLVAWGAANSSNRPVGTLSPARTPSTPGNVLAGAPPHTIEGGWRGRRRAILRRAFAAAALNAVAGLAGARASAPRESGR